MSDRIDGTLSTRPGPAGKVGAANGKANGKSAAGASSAPAGDTVNLTDTATSLKGLEQSMASGPEVNRARIESIKEALASGTYQIDARRVADKFLEIERALGKI